MKTIALIGLITVATASMGMAAETFMTIQNNSTIRIDPMTGQVKGDAQTQVRGIRKHHEAPQAVNTSPGGPSSVDPTAATTPVSVATPTGLDDGTAPVGAAPTTTPTTPTCPTCPTQPVVGGLQN
ncbi:MAG: hypothetical protein ACLP5H_09690 [Desulfomonilaceae bacterium]